MDEKARTNREREKGKIAQHKQKERGRKGKMLTRRSENGNGTKFVNDGERKSEINRRGRQSESFGGERVRVLVKKE